MASNVQELFHDEAADCLDGAAHLSDPVLHERLVRIVHRALRDLAGVGLPLDVLEVGAATAALPVQSSPRAPGSRRRRYPARPCAGSTNASAR
ncbi:MAG: hypothetical protein ACRD2W_23355 [Acidimicrobiales bacterium]